MWDTAAARKEGRLGVYLESLCYRMNVLGGSARSKGGGKSHFALMGVALEFVKTSHEKRVEKLTSTERAPIPSNTEGVSARNTNDRTSTTFAKGPTKCPMLNGTLREIANDPSSPWHPSSSVATTNNNGTAIPSFDPSNPISQEFDFGFGEWGTSFDDFSWDNMDCKRYLLRVKYPNQVDS